MVMLTTARHVNGQSSLIIYFCNISTSKHSSGINLLNFIYLYLMKTRAKVVEIYKSMKKDH